MSGFGMIIHKVIPAEDQPGRLQNQQPKDKFRSGLKTDCQKLKKKDLKATKNRLVAAISKYLEDCDVIKKGDPMKN
jgi:hypothetical protein